MSSLAAFLIATAVGFLPHEIGRLVDPYDAYPSQFVATFDGHAIREHGRLLSLRCLPRLIAGTELDGFDLLRRRGQTVFSKLIGYALDGQKLTALPAFREWLAVILLFGFIIVVIRLIIDSMLPG